MTTINYKQLCKENNKTKLIEFNDKLQVNDFSAQAGCAWTTVHGKFSRIEVTIVDYSLGNKDKTQVLNYNFEPDRIKAIAQIIISGRKEFFDSKGMLEQKINFYQKDAKNYSPVSSINIKYQEQMHNPWTIYIENGIGIAVKNVTGGVCIKKGSYKKTASSMVCFSEFDMIEKMITIRDHILEFETAYKLSCLKNRNRIEKNYIEEQKKNNYSAVQNTVVDINQNEIKEIDKVISVSESNVQSDEEDEFICSDCKEHIEKAVYDYSVKTFKKPLCRKCQANQKKYKCSDCKTEIDENVKNYSVKKYGKPLCIKCQKNQSHK